jgi:hypothetical protein
MSDIIDEGFEDVALLEVVEGWCLQNNSSPLGITSWFQGNTSVFSAHAGDPDSYIAANYNASGSPGDISLWLTTPELEPTDLQGYPEEWTQFTYDIAETGQGCLAFRYYVHDSGPSGVNSNYIGVDTWQVSSTGGDGGSDDGGGVPATTMWGVIVLIALVLGITLFYMRRRAKA